MYIDKRDAILINAKTHIRHMTREWRVTWRSTVPMFTSCEPVLRTKGESRANPAINLATAVAASRMWRRVVAFGTSEPIVQRVDPNVLSSSIKLNSVLLPSAQMKTYAKGPKVFRDWTNYRPVVVDATRTKHCQTHPFWTLPSVNALANLPTRIKLARVWLCKQF